MTIRPLDALAPSTRNARVPLDSSGPIESLLGRVSRRMYAGKVLDPLKAGFHHRGFLASWLGLEMSAKRWKKLPETLQALAVMAVAHEIGCSFCTDFGYWEYHHRGVDLRKLRDIGAWHTSPVYTDLERAVIQYSVAATAVPSAVTDELADALRPDLDDAQIVELAALVALENFRSRFNAGLGLSSQGFRDDCEVPSRDVG